MKMINLTLILVALLYSNSWAQESPVPRTMTSGNPATDVPNFYGSPAKFSPYWEINHPRLRAEQLLMLPNYLQGKSRMDIEGPAYANLGTRRQMLTDSFSTGWFQTKPILALLYDFWAKYHGRQITLKVMNFDHEYRELTGTFVDFGENGDYLDPWIQVGSIHFSIRFLVFSDMLQRYGYDVDFFKGLASDLKLTCEGDLELKLKPQN